MTEGTSPIKIRSCTEEDIIAIRGFLKECPPLAVHTGYTLWVMFKHFTESCFVLEENNQIVGYASGMKSQSSIDTLFVWQIGVAASHRHRGYSILLWEELAKAARQLNCTKLQVTIGDDNGPSINSLNRFAKKNKLEVTAETLMEYPHSVTEQLKQDRVYEVLMS